MPNHSNHNLTKSFIIGVFKHILPLFKKPMRQNPSLSAISLK